MPKQENSLSEVELNQIIEDYKKNIKEYKNYCEYLLNELNEISDIHLINFRVKDPAHLRAKIIRKNKENRNINLSNYRTEITDLIGIRALHTFKDEWENIDKYIRGHLSPYEKIAYIREGDSNQDFFKNRDFIVKKHKFGYRSLHYTFKTSELNFDIIGEIQVRTIFEEAWSEIDHRIRYPEYTDNKIIDEYSLILNRLVGLGDEMGMNLKNIKKDICKKDIELEEYINKLKIEKNEKFVLKEKINNRELLIGAGALIGLLSNNKKNK